MKEHCKEPQEERGEQGRGKSGRGIGMGTDWEEVASTLTFGVSDTQHRALGAVQATCRHDVTTETQGNG